MKNYGDLGGYYPDNTLLDIAARPQSLFSLFAEIEFLPNERTNKLPILFQNRAQAPLNNCSIPDDWLYPLCKYKIEVTTLHMAKGAFNQFCKTNKRMFRRGKGVC